MGTVFTGTVMIMGNVQILIYVVVTKRNLGIDIELPGVHPGNVEKLQLLRNLPLVQEVQTACVLVYRNLMQSGLIRNAIFIGI